MCKIAIDTMGGDKGSSVIIEGAFLALKKDSNLKFSLVKHIILNMNDHQMN